MKFQHKPYSKYIVKEIAELSQDDFAKLLLSLEENFAIWCNGVLVHLSEYENKPKDTTKTFEILQFAKCSKQPEYLTNNGFKLETIDVSGSRFHKNLVEWLKHSDFWRCE